jgi:hypothetical protein
MTKEEATSLLEDVLRALAMNAVHNKRLLEYADELERYIAYLEKEEREDNTQTMDEVLDEPKPETE